jgi:hypothetical protein
MYPSPNNQTSSSSLSSSRLFFTANTIDKFHDTNISTSNNNNNSSSSGSNNSNSYAVVSIDTHNNIDGEQTSIDGTTVTLSNYQTNSNSNVKLTCQEVLFTHDPYHDICSHYESGVSNKTEDAGDDEMEILLSSLINIGSYVPSSV